MKKDKNQDNKQMQYSKKILTAMLYLWFAGAIFGMLFVSVQLVVGILSPESLTGMNVSTDGLLNYIGIPMTGGTIGYLMKSALENKEKIQQNFENKDIPL